MKLPDIAADAAVQAIVKRAIEEDLGDGDVTSQALIPATARAEAEILARGEYVVCGVPVAALVFRNIEPGIAVNVVVNDGDRVKAGGQVMTVKGSARAILAAERTALNFLQRLTGIATLTDRFVEKLKPMGVAVRDTRKTAPGQRALDKYAVLCGGGSNHRKGLYDMVLIKDNHKSLWKRGGGGELGCAVVDARKRFPDLAVEVEVETEEELSEALRAKPDWILLDNMTPDMMERCVRTCAGRCALEASGSVTLANVERIARTGVNAVSVGALTHSAPAADLSLEICS
jgi:nicotinate-nucleotide pyrophosphorylase (carboxylating)